MFWKNGSYYKGNWAHGIQHGEGKYIFIQAKYLFLFKATKKVDSTITKSLKFGNNNSSKNME